MSEDLLMLLKIGEVLFGLVMLGLFIAIPILLGRILRELRVMNESLEILRYNSIKEDRRAEVEGLESQP